jgi:pyruvate kinase
MLAKIAVATEAGRPRARLKELHELCREQPSATAAEAIASVVELALETVPFTAVFVPTRSGSTARMISRFRPAVWIVAISAQTAVCRGLLFSYGVHPVEQEPEADRWGAFAARWVRDQRVSGHLAILVTGPSDRNPDANHRIEFLRVGDTAATTAARRQ